MSPRASNRSSQYPFRKLRAKQLLTIGGVLLVLTSLSYIGKGFAEREMITNGRAAPVAVTGCCSLIGILQMAGGLAFATSLAWSRSRPRRLQPSPQKVGDVGCNGDEAVRYERIPYTS